VWGSDQASVDAGLAAARETGKIGDGDIVVAGVWPTELKPQPATRWIFHHTGRSQLSPDERHTLCDILRDMVDREAAPAGSLFARFLPLRVSPQ
jgi:hypothetical protein